MGEIQRLSRRAFVFGSAAIAGGIAFGAFGDAAQAATASDNPLAVGLGPDAVTFNPWVEISPEKSRSSRSTPISARASARCSRS